MLIKLRCNHKPLIYRLEFCDITTGNYVLELCKKCREAESKDFLVKEGVIDSE